MNTKHFVALVGFVLLLSAATPAYAMTNGQATSLVSVCQAFPSTNPAPMVSLLVAFSGITQSQASSLINVCQQFSTANPAPLVNLLLSYAGGVNVQSTFSATPTSGTAPLTVQFSSTGSPGTDIGSSVNFADGTAGNLNPTPVCSGCNPYAVVSHTYTVAGTYAAVLENSAGAVLNKVTVTVTPANTSSTFSATPTSGTAPLTVNFSGVGTSINFGNGTGQSQSAGLPINQTSYTYTTPGTYTATSGGSSVTITVSGSAASCTSNCFSATPTSGTAPLTVQFSSTGSPGTDIGSSVNFADGTAGNLNPTPVCSGCNPYAVVSHTYTVAGTYAAVLENSAGAVLNKVTVTVTPANTSSTFSATPTSGTAPLTVQFSSTGSPGTDIGSSVNFADGTAGNLNPTPVCSGCNPYAVVSHTYTVAGTYAAVLENSAGAVLNKVTVTVTPANTSSTFSATPTSGTAPLTVNFSGVGTSINFGNGTGQSQSAGLPINQTSYTYTTPGTYTATSGGSSVTITVR